MTDKTEMDDLVERLQAGSIWGHSVHDTLIDWMKERKQAVDRIKELKAKLAEAERVARYESDIAQQALDQMRAAEAALRALPTHTAAELMARIHTGENE